MESNAVFWQVLNDRSSIRRYREQPVPQEMLDALISAMKRAPVAGGDRNVTCQVFTDPERIRHIAEGTKQACAKSMESIRDDSLRRNTLAYSSNFYWFGRAPVLLAVSCRKTPAYIRDLFPNADDLFGARASAAMAVQNILLAATAMGLGSCCLTGPLIAEKWLHKELGCPGQNVLTFLVTVGFPARSGEDGDMPFE